MLTWTAADGRSLALTGDYRVQTIDGFGGAPVELQLAKAPYQDGQTLIDQLLEPRALTLELVITGGNEADIYERRRILVSLFNPKLGPGVLAWTRDDATYAIRVVADEAPELPSKWGTTTGPRHQIAIINLRAPDPCWYEPEAEEWTMASVVGGWAFDWSFPLSFGDIGRFRTLENRGDVATPVFIVFEGPLVNPVLTNVTTGESIEINATIPGGERLEINTAFGEKTVTRVDAEGNRYNAFHYVSPASVLWQLVPGSNEVSYAASGEAGDAAATISYYHRYVGV